MAAGDTPSAAPNSGVEIVEGIPPPETGAVAIELSSRAGSGGDSWLEKAVFADVSPWNSYTLKICGGKWNWVHSTSSRGKHVPLVVPALMTAMAVGYWHSPGPYPEQAVDVKGNFKYTEHTKWWTVFTVLVSHLNSRHILNNLLQMLAGLLLELTEGSLRVLIISWGAQACAMGLHSAYSDRSVVGASGVAEGFLWSQLALLALNWQEMPFRRVRLGIMLALLVVNVAAVATDESTEVAHLAHLGGAFAAICIAVVLGVNVYLRTHELLFNWLAVASFAGLCALILARGQGNAGCCAVGVLPVLITNAFIEGRKSPPQAAAAAVKPRTNVGV